MPALLDKPDSGVHRNKSEGLHNSTLAPLVLAQNISTDHGEVTMVRLKNFKDGNDRLRNGVIEQIKSYLPNLGVEPKPKLWISIDYVEANAHPELALFQMHKFLSPSAEVTFILRSALYQSCMATPLGKVVLKPQQEEQSPYKEALQSLLRGY